MYAYSGSFPKSLVKVTKTSDRAQDVGEATKIRELNNVGGCVREGLSADDAFLSPTSATDRVTDSAITVEQDANGLWRVTRKSIYPDANSAQAKLVRTTREKLGGFADAEIERAETTDIAGNVTIQRTLLVGAMRQERVARPGITGEEVVIYHGEARMTEAQPGIGGIRTFSYDALGREVSRKEPRHTAPSTTTYVSGTNLVASTTDAAGNTTSYAYYGQGVAGAGKVKAIILPDSSVKYTAYTLRGEKRAEWGSQTYSAWFEYDIYGQLHKLHTWHTAPSIDVNALPETPPAGSAVTTWNYDDRSGVLISKRYADDKGPDYTYGPGNRLNYRIWARSVNGARLATHYTWNDFGQMIGVDYADDTPDVMIGYDRLGRIVNQGNGVATSAFTYSASTLLLNSETISYDLNRDGTPELTRQLNRGEDSYLRYTGYQMKDGATIEAQATYGYDDAGRIDTVNGGSLGIFTYDYVPGSSLIGMVTGPVHTVTNTYELNRDVLTLKENKIGETLVSAYDYTVNSRRKRTNVNQTGTAFASNRNIVWGYDGLGQVTSADSSDAGHDRAYEYDGMGNRTKSADSLTLPGSNNYSANALNQYTALGNLNPVFDDDGNAVAYPLPASPTVLSSLVWDGENRLKSTIVNGLAIVYHYDSWNRQIAQVTESTSKFVVYDGWNGVGRYSGNNLERTQLWGLDLNGALQGAGGVGGLLAIGNPGPVHHVAYDGNGNVSEYLTSSGGIAAHFEYDPFGCANSFGDFSDSFDIRFSTKIQEPQTGLSYYGLRCYDPRTGRWLSRDPITEKGGFNIYQFVNNCGVGAIDFLGLADGSLRNFPTDCCLIQALSEKDMLKKAHKLVTDHLNAGPDNGYGQQASSSCENAKKMVDAAAKCVDLSPEQNAAIEAIKGVIDMFCRGGNGASRREQKEVKKALRELIDQLDSLEAAKGALEAAQQSSDASGGVEIKGVTEATETAESKAIHDGAKAAMVVSGAGIVVMSGGALGAGLAEGAGGLILLEAAH